MIFLFAKRRFVLAHRFIRPAFAQRGVLFSAFGIESAARALSKRGIDILRSFPQQRLPWIGANAGAGRPASVTRITFLTAA